MTESESKARGCSRKKGYDTIPQARKTAAYVWSQTGTNLKVYKCHYCGKYHLTHKLDFDAESGGGHDGTFVSSPNFTGACRNILWDHNDMEVREKNKQLMKEMSAKELDAMRPDAPNLDKESLIENPKYSIDQENYISGRNRYKHKMRERDKVNLCIRCRRPIRILDASMLCEDCRDVD